MAPKSTAPAHRFEHDYRQTRRRASPSGILPAMDAEVSIAAWNVFQGLLNPGRANAWAANPGLIDKIGALDADVLVLPELWQFRHPEATLAEDVAGALGYELHQWISDRPSRKRENVRWRMAVLTRIPVRPLDPLLMPQLGPFARRAVLRLHLIDSGLNLAGLHLYGIHLLINGAPRGWMQERSYLRDVAANHDVVLGDFNMWSPLVKRDARSLRPAVTGRTFPAPRPHSQIDHMLVSERVRVVDSAVLPDQGSDHRAVRAVLRAADGSN